MSGRCSLEGAEDPYTIVNDPYNDVNETRRLTLDLAYGYFACAASRTMRRKGALPMTPRNVLTS